METVFYKELSEKHDKHWWFLGRIKILETLFSKFLSSRKNIIGKMEILDIGCGTASYFRLLEKFGIVSGTESSQGVIDELISRGFKNNFFRAELPNMNLKKTFDLITAFEILEHIERDDEALLSLNKHLNEGGMLFGTVPAYRWLWSAHDEIAHHKRRYTRRELKEKLTNAGFKVNKISYFNTFLFPIAAIIRVFKKTILKNILPKSDFSTGLSQFDPLLKHIFASERYFLKYLNFPFGFSLMFIALKNNNVYEK